MSKQPYISNRGRPRSSSLGRNEQTPEDDRPFAEIRKNLHDALRMLALHRWAFFVPFSAVTCAAFVLSLYYPRTYRAVTTFERRNDPVMMNLPMSSGAASFKYFRSTMVRDLKSIECMSEVVENLGLIDDIERDPSGELSAVAKAKRNSLGRKLAAGISISTVSPSDQMDVITVTYTGPESKIGKRLVDEVKRTYIRRTMVWIHEFLTSQRDYFQSEADEALSEVKVAQREETHLRLENPHADPFNPGAVTLSLVQRQTEQRELQLRKREYSAELSAQQQLLATMTPFSVLIPANEKRGNAANGGDALENTNWISPLALGMQSKINEISSEIDKLKKNRGMTDLHPDVRRLLADRESLELQLGERIRLDQRLAATNVPLEAVETVMPSLVTRVAEPWHADRARLLVQIVAQKSKLRDIEISLDTNTIEIAQLEKAKREIYDKQEEFAEVMGRVSRAKQRHGQIEATLASIAPAIKAVEQSRLLRFSEGAPARGSSRPISPKATTIVLLAILAGLATGVVFVVLAEVLDRVYRSSAQVARGLGLPLLESIDEIVTAQDRRHLFLKRVVVTPLVIACFVGLTGLTGSMAYLSIESPWVYQKIRKIPDSAINLFTKTPTESDADEKLP